MTTSPKAYSYIRFSTPEQERGDSYRRQSALAAAWAASHGVELVEGSYQDLGISGFDGNNIRKGALGKFLEAVDAGDIPEGSYLLVENLDRVSRANPWEAFPVFQNIINAGITLVTLQDNKVYSRDAIRANPMQILESLFTMIRANEESETKARRVREAWGRKKQAAANEGRPMTKRLPAWLTLSSDRKAFVVDEGRAAVIRRIFKEALSGAGQHRIAELLNSEGVETFGDGGRKAAIWHRSYVKKILENPAVIGTMTPHETRRVNGKKVRDALAPIPDYYPAIIKKADFNKLNSGRPASPRMSGTTGQVSNILAGLARCPLCASTMTRVYKGRNGGSPYLICTKAKAGAGCQYHAVKLGPVETAVRHAATRQLVNEVPSGDTSVDTRLRELLAAWDGVSASVGHITEEIAQGNVSPALRRRLTDYEHQLSVIEAEQADLSAKADRLGGRKLDRIVRTLEEVASNPRSTVTELNAALRGAFDRVVVDYPEGDLAFHWRHGGAPSVVTFAMGG